MGTYCDKVIIARFLTTGRPWERRGARTGKGGGSKAVPASRTGNRLIRMERIDRVSTSASGGVLGWRYGVSMHTDLDTCMVLTFRICPNNLGVSFSQAVAATLPSGGSSAVIVLSAAKPLEDKKQDNFA